MPLNKETKPIKSEYMVFQPKNDIFQLNHTSAKDIRKKNWILVS